MAPIKVGLLGYGFSTKSFHLPFILPNPDLKVCAFLQRAEAPTDKSKVEKGKHCTVDYPDAKHYQNPDDFFADKDIELVIVCTHHDTHAEFAERALLAGNHVVVEKPFTVNTPEAGRVIEASKKSGKILTIFQSKDIHLPSNNAQSHSTHSTYMTFIPTLRFRFPNPSPPRPKISSWNTPDHSLGSGIMFGLGSHTIDQALLLFGRPKSVTGFYRFLRGIESKTDDTFTIILQYGGEKKNFVVTIKTSVVTPMQLPLKYLVRGYDGSFVKYGDDKQESQIAAGLTTESPGFGVEPEETYGLLTTKEKVHEMQELDAGSGRWIGKFPSLKGEYTLFYTDLVKAIRGEGELAVKPEQSRDGIRVIELARESADKGCSLPFV